MEYTMKEMTAAIGVSNTTLKRYERNGLIPVVSYTTGKHRRYQTIHLTAFKTVRKLLQGFGIAEGYQLMRLAKAQQFTEAYWVIAAAQKELVKKKNTLEIYREFILNFPHKKVTKKVMRIGELAKFADIETSTIRYWEERGLIKSIREESSGYRFFPQEEVRKTVVISLLRKSVYNIEEIRGIITTMDDDKLSSIKNHYAAVNHELDTHLKRQLEGISLYMVYCEELQVNMN